MYTAQLPNLNSTQFSFLNHSLYWKIQTSTSIITLLTTTQS
uniref:Uncharacterized protein n=1 Tax=Rhizophora mucronata TaxID=61149 RepID=A0A2P2QT02_RHIMU